MQGIIAATKSSLMIENDLSIQFSDSGSFDGIFDHIFDCQGHQSATIRESTPLSDSSAISDDPLPPSPIVPFSPAAPDISFLSNCSMSSPTKSTAHEQIEPCDILSSSTPERIHALQEEKSSSQEISISRDEALSLSHDKMSISHEQACPPQENFSLSPEHNTNPTPCELCLCYKLVGDNIDKKVKPRDMRADHQSQSLHYFNMYAVQDRVDLSHLSNESRITDPDEIDFSKFLPSAEDYKAIIDNFIVLISRILVKHLPHFSQYASVVPKDIKHKYSKEMSKRSNVVSLCLKFFHYHCYIYMNIHRYHWV